MLGERVNKRLLILQYLNLSKLLVHIKEFNNGNHSDRHHARLRKDRRVQTIMHNTDLTSMSD